MNIRYISSALICLTLFLASGYLVHASEPSPKDNPLLYGIHPGQSSDFWNIVEQGAAKAAEERGYQLIYRAAAQTDHDTQREIFNIALKSGAKGIFIAPNSDKRDEDVALAQAQGVPVVYFDRTMGKPAIASFIGTNNYSAGKLAAQELVKKMGSGKSIKVAVFRMDQEVVPTSDRERGFMDGVKEAGYEVVAAPYVTSEVGEARSRILKLLSDPATPKFDAIFTSNEYDAVATVLTLQMLGKTKDYVHIGFDAGDTIEKAIREGDMYGTIVQQPYQMGYYSVKALDDVLHKKQVESYIESDVLFVSKDNVDSYKATEAVK